MHSKNTDWSRKSYKTLEIGVKYAYMWRKLDYVNLSYDRTGSLSPFSSVHYCVSFWKSVCLFIWNYTAPSALDLKRFFSRLVFWNLFIEKLRSLSPCFFFLSLSSHVCIMSVPSVSQLHHSSSPWCTLSGGRDITSALKAQLGFYLRVCVWIDTCVFLCLQLTLLLCQFRWKHFFFMWEGGKKNTMISSE